MNSLICNTKNIPNERATAKVKLHPKYKQCKKNIHFNSVCIIETRIIFTDMNKTLGLSAFCCSTPKFNSPIVQTEKISVISKIKSKDSMSIHDLINIFAIPTLYLDWKTIAWAIFWALIVFFFSQWNGKINSI